MRKADYTHKTGLMTSEQATEFETRYRREIGYELNRHWSNMHQKAYYKCFDLTATQVYACKDLENRIKKGLP